MSAMARIEQLVHNLIETATGRLDARVDALEQRVSALEQAEPPAAAPKATTARAGAAKATGKASSA